MLPSSPETAVDSDVVFRGFEMWYLDAPVHVIYLESGLVKGPVAVGVRPSFPTEGVDFILGNDLAGGKILVKPEVTVVPVAAKNPDKLAREYPEVFSACTVTRAMSKRGLVNKDVIDLSDR